MKKFLHRLVWRFRGLRVYALVGKSGTGKSFRARLVMEKYSIDVMIDDGLVIRDQKIVAGRSAKRENSYLTAVKTALFTDKEHRKEVLAALEREKAKRVLVLGTSNRMVERIASTLQLPPPVKIINIEDIATAEEIDTAIHYRNVQGSHIIPVPAIEVKRNYPQVMGDSIKILLKKGFGFFRSQNIYEKTVVRPDFSNKGSVTISKAALSQMIMHCVDEYAPETRLRKVVVRNDASSYKLDVSLAVPYGSHVGGAMQGLQSYIIEHVERYTGIIIKELNIVIDTVGDRRGN